ncbi:peptidoglycan-binding protein [Streptomyces uncialis]|uniref:peptidoglycan-binding domain-containing protein n=1 Tax=Streptomyces uncialis TaxID=1048205 RepID=UPI00225C1F7C|nr:peptidoglycan-binding domain-containing protein [Streptomyces uncialis]MCX4663571.1 peptidoglycan-binding protein [Streptomyces uncialis]
MSATDTGGGTHGRQPGPDPEPGSDLRTDSVSRRRRVVPRGRRGPLLIGVAVAVAAVAVGGAIGLDPGGDEDPPSGGRGGTSVEVTRRTLVDQTAVDGTLGHGPEIPLPVKATGTVTWLPQQGDRITRGATVLRVDDRPVTLLYGALPMYRDLGPGGPLTPDTSPGPSTAKGADDANDAEKGTDGPAQTSGPDTADAPQGTAGTDTTGSTGGTGSTGMDVRQFETNLAALGYIDFTVDDRYTAKTAAAVKRWQKHLGVPETGRIAVGDVVYTSGRITVGRVAVRVGAQASPEALGYTGGERRVTVEASAQDGAWAVRGTRVTVEVPGGEPVEGRVRSVSREMRSAEGADPEGGGKAEGAQDATFTVTIRLLDQSAIGRTESAPVTVRYVSDRKAGVLAVPVAALVALAEGGHGLERAGAEGGFVAVRTGLFAEGMVEVSGRGVRAGMKVRVPE